MTTAQLVWILAPRLPVTGDISAAQATQAVLLPGVLLTDGTTTWFGEAQAR